MVYLIQKRKSSMEDCKMEKKDNPVKKQTIRQKIQKNWKRIVFGGTEKKNGVQTRRLYLVVVAVFFLYLLLSFLSS